MTSKRTQAPRHRLALMALALVFGLAGTARAQGLTTLYELARAFDATYLAARAQADAAEYRAAQAKALGLPSLTGNIRGVARQVDLPRSDFNSNNALQTELNGRYPLFNKANQASMEQAERSLIASKAELEAAEQDLIIRLTQAYFDVLAAKDDVALAKTNKAYILEQLASARRNFEVGTATITDTHEAQARYDLAEAQAIAEQNTLNIRLRALEKLIGKPAGALDALIEPARLKAATGDIDEWAERAASGNLQAGIQRIAKAIADQEVERSRAGHYPTLDAVAGYSVNNNQNFGALQADMRTASIGLQLNLPIYQGGLASSRVREAVANQEKARQDLEAAARDAGLSARQAYLNVESGVARVRALEQALVSSRAQLDSTKLGLSVGVRTNLDVLNAEQQVLSARRDLAGARYAWLLAGLALKAAVGTLAPLDLDEVDQYLKPAAAQ